MPLKLAKPDSVKKALITFWITVGLILVLSAVEYTKNLEQGITSREKMFLFSSTIISISFSAIFIFLIGRRKNWARWIYVGFCLTGSAFSIIPAIQYLMTNPLQQSLMIIQIILRINASILIFKRPSDAWFKGAEASAFVEDEQAIKPKRNYKMIVSISLFLITLPVLGQMFVLAGLLSYQAIHSAFFNSKSVVHSKHIGKEIRLAPFAVVTKMKDYGGWRDQYHYIFANRPELQNQPRLNEFTTFKVIDEKTESRMLNPTNQICILENQRNKKQIASIECNEIPHINEATDVIYKLHKELEMNGKVYLASTADRRDSKLKPVLMINRFLIFEINNKTELKELVAPNNDQNESYDFLMRLTHLIPLRESEVFDEAEQSKFFLHHFGGYWEPDLYGHIDFEKYIQNNKTTPDMEQWLKDNHANGRDRWAIRTILSIVQQALTLESKMDEYRSTEFLKGLEASKACVAKYYSIPESAKNDIDVALTKFLEKSERKIAFDKINSKFIKKYAGNVKPCYDFYPPSICGEEEKCEFWKR